MFWILPILIFTRPFIASLAFPYANLAINTLILIALLICLLDRKLNLQKLGSLRFPLVLFIAGLLISLAFSPSKTRGFFELYKYFIGALLFLWGLSLENNEKQRVISVIAWSGIIISILAIYQYLWGFQHILTYAEDNNITSAFMSDYIASRRVFFPFVTPNMLGGYLAMIIALAFSLKHRILYIIPLGLALVLTASLGGILSLCIGTAVFYGLTAKSRKTFFTIGLILLALGILVFCLRLTTHRAHQLPSFSGLMRLNYWKETLKLIAHTPFTGAGPGNFSLRQARFAHNSYLQIWAELGISALIGYIWLVAAAFSKLKCKIPAASINPVSAGACAAASVFLFHNLIDFSFFLPETALIWWVILGLSVNLKNFPSKA